MKNGLNIFPMSSRTLGYSKDFRWHQARAFAFLAVVMMIITIRSMQAQTETILYNFTGAGDGGEPLGALVRDAKGNLYGTTYGYGANGSGTVFKVSPSGTETVLYSFAGVDGVNPASGLALDAKGNLYGTTTAGGASGKGTVIEVTSAGAEKVLHSFTGGADGSVPYAGVVFDTKGNLYGTTAAGGTSTKCAGGCGTVFEVTFAGQEKVLHSFAGGPDGAIPYAGLVLDAKGNLYGTTAVGGTSTNCPFTPSGCGTVFRVTPGGKEKVLYSFTGGTADGAFPEAGLVIDSTGSLYGTTVYGGPSGAGTVFRLASSGKEKVLYSFTGGADGGYSYGGLVRDGSGNLFGTTYRGGDSTSCTGGCGTVFEVTSGGKEKVLYSFKGVPDGAYPAAGLIRDTKGNLYGATSAGGAVFGYSGVMFRIH